MNIQSIFDDNTIILKTRIVFSKMNYPRLLFICLIISANKPVFCQTYVFAQLNGIPMNTKGWNLVGDAHVGNVTGSADSELILVRSAKLNSGAIFYGEPINLSRCFRWTAEFDFRMFDGTGADGLAFCFLDVPPSGFVNGGGLGIPDAANGLKVCFDTWNNCIPFDTATVHQDMPKIELRWGVGYDDDTDPNNIIYGECRSGPTIDNADGKLSFVRSPNYNHAKITYDSGTIKVYVNDVLYLSGSQGFNFNGYMGFTASTGGYTDTHSIKNVIIYTEMPPSVAGNSQSFCPYDTVQLGGPANPAYAYSWSPTKGLNDTSVSSPFLHISNDSSTSQFHTYYVRTAFKNQPGCASVDSVTVRVYPNPKVNFVTPEICLTDAIAQFYDSSYTNDNTTIPFSYLWNFGDPNAQPANPNSSSLQNPTHHYSAASNYMVGLTVTNNLGCTDSSSKIFTVNGAVPKAGFTIHNPSGLCSNSAVQIINNSIVDFGSIVRVQIFWGDSSGLSYTDSTPYPGKSYTHNYPNPVSANNIMYTIRMISSSGIICENELDQQITIQPSPHVQFSNIPPVCAYDSAFNLTQASELTGITGSFLYSGKGISSAGVFDPRIAGAGVDTLFYKYTGANGCTDSAYQTIYVQAPPIVNAGNDTLIVINQPLQLLVTSTDLSGDSFLWTPSTGLSDSTIDNPVAILGTGIDSIQYFVKGIDSLGCYGASSIKIKIFKTQPDIFVPNAFTPGKNMNSIFKPIAVGISSLQFFRIYNRSGRLIYNTSQLGEGWDGTISGKPQDTDTFVWMLEATTYLGKVIYKKGTVTLIR